MKNKITKAVCIEYFEDQGKVKSIISRYGKSKYGIFSKRLGSNGLLGGYRLAACTISKSRYVTDIAVSYEYISKLIEAGDMDKLRSLQKDDRIYFIDNITDRILSDIDTILANCVFMYQIMIGYYESIDLDYQCLDLYPSKNTISEWYDVLLSIEKDVSVHQYVDLVNDMFINSAIRKCEKLLDSGLVFSDAIDILMNDVSQRIDKRFPDFAFATQLLVSTCSHLAEIAITRNMLNLKL